MIGLMPAVTTLIFLDKIALITAEGTFSLWLQFIFCTITGTVGELAAESVKGKTIREIKTP
ncbi:MAG: hypothetical protein D3909_06455 [Candidatus Electrothrix sp. ATG1]|nr:hypothetical protein [Candidatus Electrothrix sp. ATG1]